MYFLSLVGIGLRGDLPFLLPLSSEKFFITSFSEYSDKFEEAGPDWWPPNLWNP
jgi:hypothetical protein